MKYIIPLSSCREPGHPARNSRCILTVGMSAAGLTAGAIGDVRLRARQLATVCGHSTDWQTTVPLSHLDSSAMLDRSLRLAVRNYSTLFLFVVVLLIPLHLAYTYAFRDVFTVSELHPQIANLTGERRVHGVGPDDLRAAQLTLLGLSLAELALAPLFARGARAALATDAAGGVPTATRAWRGVLTGPSGREERVLSEGFAAGGSRVVGVLGALLAAAAVGLLVERVGILAIQPLRGEQLWAAAGVVQAVARAAGAPFLLAGLALAAGERPARARPLSDGRPASGQPPEQESGARWRTP